MLVEISAYLERGRQMGMQRPVNVGMGDCMTLGIDAYAADDVL